MNLPLVCLQRADHRGKAVIKLHFEKNEPLLALLRSNKSLLWSQTMRCWYLPYRSGLRQELLELLRGKAWLDYQDLNRVAPTPERKAPGVRATAQPDVLPEESLKKIDAFKSWMRSRRYSESTVGSYSDALRVFLRFYVKKPLVEIVNDDIIRFNNDYILKNELSASYQNQVVNAIKLFFRTIENRKIDPESVHRPRREKRLPNVLSKEEVKLLLNIHVNLKHKAMLSLIYSCGLRRSELLNLKLNDIDSKRGLVIIRRAKGRKDRIVPLSNKMLTLLRDYFTACKPKNWLFEGQGGKGQYDERSLASVLKQALEKSRINKPVTLHWLRHSYATHLLESGTDLRYIQEILGHSRSATTEIYTHVSTKSIQKVVSPFDHL